MDLVKKYLPASNSSSVYVGQTLEGKIRGSLFSFCVIHSGVRVHIDDRLFQTHDASTVCSPYKELWCNFHKIVTHLLN